METTVHEQEGVIIRRFSGEVRIEAMIESWRRLFQDFPDLKKHKGILINYLEAELIQEDSNLNFLVEFLRDHLDQLQHLKIAIVIDTPMITNTIILGERMRSLQIRPFTTVDAAMRWIRL